MGSPKLRVSLDNTVMAAEDVYLDALSAPAHHLPLQRRNKVSGVIPPRTAPPTRRQGSCRDDPYRFGRRVVFAPVMFDFGPVPGDPERRARPAVGATDFPVGRLPRPGRPGLLVRVPSDVGPSGPAASAVKAALTMRATTSKRKKTMSSTPTTDSPTGDSGGSS